MTALQKARAASVREVTRDYRPLAGGAKVFKGALAVVYLTGAHAGFYHQGDGTITDVTVAVGRFYEDVDNSAGADGDLNAQIDFFRERHLFLLDNDTGTPVVAADREGPCYVLDDHTVTGAVNTSGAGTVYDVTTEGVWVEVDQPELSSGADAAGLSNNVPQVTTATLGTAGVGTAAARDDHTHQILSIHEVVADHTALKAIPANARANGMVVAVLAGQGGAFELWRFHSTSTAADTSENLVAVPGVGTGRWLRADRHVVLSLPVTNATADAAVIFTVPVGCLFKPLEAWWDVLVDWTGGAASAIGVSSSVAGYNTKGDILGGAAGDVLATLVASSFPRETGTIGAKLVTATANRLIMTAADTLKFDRITSAFTAGSANVRVRGEIITHPGA